MRKRIAAVLLAMAVASCGGGGGGGDDNTEPVDTSAGLTDLDAPVAGFGGMVNRANDVADASNDRLADLENQLTP